MASASLQYHFIASGIPSITPVGTVRPIETSKTDRHYSMTFSMEAERLDRHRIFINGLSILKMRGQIVDWFVLDQYIRSSALGSVWRAHPLRSHLPISVKLISKSELPDKSILIREVSILRQINHPFISQFFQMTEDSDNYYLIQEFVAGVNISNHVSPTRTIPETRARRCFMQLISALEYLHTIGDIVHCDIKDTNILFDDHDNIKLIDFGLGREFESPDEQLSSSCGSPCYVAPEVLRQEAYTTSVDVWSIGVVLFHMVSGTLPFIGPDRQSTYARILEAAPVFPRTFSPCLVHLLRRMLCKDPAERITIAGIKRHQWLSFPESEAVAQFALEVSGETGIDCQAVEAMKADGIKCTDLAQALFLGEQNELTMLYAIYRRARISGQSGQLVVTGSGRRRLLAALTMGQGTAQILVRPQIVAPRPAAAEEDWTTARVSLALAMYRPSSEALTTYATTGRTRPPL
jgi:hypothetical protein